MALAERQISVRDLVMGRGTPYMIQGDINPFKIAVRADQTGDRPWGHGGWSGAEFRDQNVIPIRIHAEADPPTAGGAMELLHAFNAAFQPVGEVAQDVEYRATLGGREYLVFGRPRSSEPNLEMLRQGQFSVSAAFVALKPFVFAADLSSHVLELPRFTGGLSVPLLAPFLVQQTRVGGAASLTNEGIADTGLRLRIDGPAVEPRISLQRQDGQVLTLRFLLTLDAGQWLDVDTAARTVFLNGLPDLSRRGQATSDSPDWPLLPPGTSTLIFDAADRESGATLTVSYRSAW